MKKIRILLADDHALLREGLAGILSAQPDMEVVGQANDGLEAVVKARGLAPDLILMDIEMPGMDGLEATRLIKQELPETAIIMLTVQDDAEKLFESIRAGAQGYILKSVRSHDLVAMLRSTLSGEAAISPVMAGKMLDEFRRLSRLSGSYPDEDSLLLSERETEVLVLAAGGKADKEIAKELNISLHTVKSHMRSILTKLHAGNRREAAMIARNKGLI